LGYGNVEDMGDDETPAAAGDVDIGGAVLQVQAGAAHTCVLLAGGVRCFGDGSSGALGYSSTWDIGDDEMPASMPFILLD